MKLKNNPLLSGAFYLAIGSFFSKLLGAVYRIPLTNLVGGQGLGLYQMVFPVYCILLDFSGAGFPNAISKIIAENSNNSYFNENKLLKDSVKLSLILGSVGFIFMLFLAKPISISQGDENAYLGYIFLSPAVFFVSLLSCYRGYFQGKINMIPTAISQIIEQVVKLVLGLLFASIFMPNIPLTIGGATLAVSVSEFIAFIYLFFLYKVKVKDRKVLLNKGYENISFIKNARLISKTALPITLISLAIPFSQVIDSFLIINLLNNYRTDSTILFGLLTGSATTVINLPVTLCYGIATSVIPLLSSQKNKIIQEKSGDRARNLTLLLAFPCTILMIIFAPFIVNILYGSLSSYEKNVTINLIKIMAVNVTLLSFLQTQNAILTGVGKTYYALIGLGVGIAVKIILSIILIPIQKVNIYGGAIAIFACYFVACLVNFILSKLNGSEYANKKYKYRQLIS